jgi:hypothetical protein
MRRTWLIFSQAVTVAVAVLFVVATLKPEWLNRPSGQARNAGGRQHHRQQGAGTRREFERPVVPVLLRRTLAPAQ